MEKEEAVKLYESEFWKDMTDRERAMFQLSEERLCMPFGVFHESVENALNRSVWTHEFAQPNLLLRELIGDKPAPTMEDIIGMIPKEKRIIVFGG
jgi:hypothetical protein